VCSQLLMVESVLREVGALTGARPAACIPAAKRANNTLISPPCPTPSTSPPQANLVCSCLAGEGDLKRTFLSTPSTLERLDNQRQLLQQLGNVQQPGCSVM